MAVTVSTGIIRRARSPNGWQSCCAAACLMPNGLARRMYWSCRAAPSRHQNGQREMCLAALALM